MSIYTNFTKKIHGNLLSWKKEKQKRLGHKRYIRSMIAHDMKLQRNGSTIITKVIGKVLLMHHYQEGSIPKEMTIM